MQTIFLSNISTDYSIKTPIAITAMGVFNYNYFNVPRIMNSFLYSKLLFLLARELVLNIRAVLFVDFG